MVSKRQQQSLQTRNNLLDAGYDVFVKNGFQKTTISKIIKKANTGYGTAYIYFKGKDDLLIVLMEDIMERFYEITRLPFQPSTKNEAVEQVKVQMGAFLRMASKERGLMQVIEEAIGISEEVHKKWNKIRERFVQRISQDILFAQDSSLANENLNSELIARGWFFANEMFLWEILKNDSSYSIDEIVLNMTSLYGWGLYNTNNPNLQ